MKNKMVGKRICPECKTTYEPTRSDQKFCDATCRWNAWRKREEEKKEIKGTVNVKIDKSLSGTEVYEKTQEPEKKDLFASIRGVPQYKATETKQEQTETTVVPTKTVEITEIEKAPEIKEPLKIGPMETKEYKEAIAEKQRVDAFGKRVIADLVICEREISEVKTVIEQIHKPTTKNYKFRRAWDVDMQDLFGEEKLMRELNNASHMEAEKQKLQDTQNKRTELMKELDQANKEMNILVNRLKTIPQFEKPKPVEKPIEKKALLGDILYGLQSKKIDQKKVEQSEQKVKEITKITTEQTESNTTEPEITNVCEQENTFEEEPNTNNSKIVSSRTMRGWKYKLFPFVGKWKDFFGTPEYAFHLAVHGKPGEGKSTFCVQFADYLAKNFGKVIYISGEEGLSKTVQDKIINNGIDNPYFFFADIKSYEEIKTEIPNEYHFVFIDSLDTLRIDPIRLKALKEHYPQSAFITISQSTKDGKMRGSLELVHDADITVKVEDGIAATTKNRFQVRGTEFKVFPSTEKPKNKFIDEPRNVM